MLDLQNTNYISLSQLARLLPASNGATVNPATCFRWATKGLKGHRLEVIHVGGRMLTTMEAYTAFAEAVASGCAPTPTPAPTPTRKQAKRMKNAQAVLQAAGCAG